MVDSRRSLKELRAKYNMTQEEVAEKLGISLPTYNSYERNFSKVRMGKAREIASFFNVEIQDIFFV